MRQKRRYLGSAEQRAMLHEKASSWAVCCVSNSMLAHHGFHTHIRVNECNSAHSIPQLSYVPTGSFTMGLEEGTSVTPDQPCPLASGTPFIRVKLPRRLKTFYLRNS